MISPPSRQEAIRIGIAVVQDPGLRLVLERRAPGLTVCPECRIDDFTHVEGCGLAARIEEVWEWLESPVGETPWELGPLVEVTRGR